MAKRKRQTREAQRVRRLDALMAKMVLDLRKKRTTTINPEETELLLKILAYALQRMTADLKEGAESE